MLVFEFSYWKTGELKLWGSGSFDDRVVGKKSTVSVLSEERFLVWNSDPSRVLFDDPSFDWGLKWADQRLLFEKV